MVLLGVDYGRRRIGLAVAVGFVIETSGFIPHRKDREAVMLKIRDVCQEKKVEKVIIGVSEGKMGKEIKEFAKGLKKVIGLGVELVDETLTSWQAEKLVGWKDKGRVDSVSAALILERYLEGG